MSPSLTSLEGVNYPQQIGEVYAHGYNGLSLMIKIRHIRHESNWVADTCAKLIKYGSFEVVSFDTPPASVVQSVQAEGIVGSQ
ncbi:hypothetical protein V6N13_046207 [Hibiscus sabdariffa]